MGELNKWHDRDSLREVWREAPTNNDVLDELLEISRESCIKYAPAIIVPDGELETWIPIRYRRAQMLLCIDEWNVSKETASSDAEASVYEGVGGSVRVARLSLKVRRLLRPESPAEGLIG